MLTRFMQCCGAGKLVPVGLMAALAGCGGGSGGGSDSGSEPEQETPALVLSGTIDIEAGTRVDADDGDNLFRGQSPLTEDQALPEQFVLAGYVSKFAGSYPEGGSFSADPVDGFTLSLSPGQSVTLQALETSAGQSTLSLSLYQDSDLIDSSVTAATQGSQAQVTLPETASSGTYRLQVEATESSPTLYILSTSLSGAAQAASWYWPDHDFVAGEAVVSFNSSGNLRAAAAAMTSGADLEPVRELGNGLWQVRAPASVQSASARQLSSEEETLAWIRELRQDPDIASVIPNYRVQAQALPTDEPWYSWQQWNYEMVGAPAAWQLAPEAGTGVTVAVLDTGLFGSPGNWHSELDPNVVIPPSETVDYVSTTYDNDSEPGYDTNPSDPGDVDGDSVYHGTHVAGIVAGVVNANGGTGLAYEASLLPVRVLGEGGEGTSADLMAALDWVIGSGTPRAEVVNMSLGGLPYLSDLYDLIQTGVDKGVVFVAAAGNGRSSITSYPAAFDNVLAVSAVDGSGELASYSNFGDWIDLAAPGGEYGGSGLGLGEVVFSASAEVDDGSLQESFRLLQGTSMAAPHVSAVVALMKNVNPDIGFYQFKAGLEAGELTQAPCNAPCSRTQDLGWGIVDAGASVSWAAASANISVPLVLSSSPSSVTLAVEGQSSETLILEAYGADTGSITIDSVSVTAPWLIADTSAIVGQTGTRFELPLRLDSEQLAEDSSEVTTVMITYRSDQERTLEIPVVGQRVPEVQLRNAGRHYVLLVNSTPVNGQYSTVAEAVVEAENGQYPFSLSLDGVEPGNYFLVAGTDLDNDGLICHAGEACAEYPVSGLRQEITITGDSSVKGLRMTTSYSRPVISEDFPELLPRPGFTGYSVMSPATGGGSLKGVATQ